MNKIMNRVLLVEDDKLLRHGLRGNLEDKNFSVLEAMSAQRMIEIIKKHPVDLILLDLGLPDGNGLDFMTSIKKHTDAPVIIMTGNHSKDSKIKGLYNGADDYLFKPFDIDELSARITANIRRYKDPSNNGLAAQEHTHSEISAFEFGGWTLNPEKFQAFDTRKKSADLTLREYNLVKTLIHHKGRALKREDLCEAIREDNYIPTPRAIDIKIARIRKKIEATPSAPKLIKTVRGVGYMMPNKR